VSTLPPHPDGAGPEPAGVPDAASLERVRASEPPRWRQTLSAVLANRLAVVGLVILGVLVLVTLFGPALAPYSVTGGDLGRRLEPPSSAHWFGTDELGRDLFSRILVGARVSLQVAVVSVGFSLVLGTLVGLVAGYIGIVARRLGPAVDAVLMRTMDVMLSFPVVLLAISIVAISESRGLRTTMLAIGIVFTPIFARVVRGSVLSVREELHIRAVRSLGASSTRILRKHVLPNVAGPIIVQASLSLAFAILIEAALSFLGLGVQPPQPAWGLMLQDAQDFRELAWWMSVFPGLAIFLTVMAFNLVGDGLRDALDPKQRSVIESRGQET
jgi:peptide/nickel transport system permease protein